MTEKSALDEYLCGSDKQELYFECLLNEDSLSPLSGELLYNTHRSISENYLDLCLDLTLFEEQPKELTELTQKPVPKVSKTPPVSNRIGLLTAEERSLKVQKYLMKKERRNWNRKVSYGCRKKVAENRVRVKGRFVTKEQANVLKDI